MLNQSDYIQQWPLCIKIASHNWECYPWLEFEMIKANKYILKLYFKQLFKTKSNNLKLIFWFLEESDSAEEESRDKSKDSDSEKLQFQEQR